MKTVLFAWELGGGFGHIAAIRRYATRLARYGARMVAVVKTPQAAGPLTECGVEVLQAPLWPEASFTPAERAATSSVTMGDSLATIGMSNGEAFGALLTAWDRLLKTIDPDLVVAEFSPAASFLSRGRIPTLIAGNGFTVPPSDMTHFPLLHRGAPLWDEMRLLTILNKAAREFSVQPMQRLPQLFSGDDYLIETFPLLDPYDLQRLTPADGPAFDHSPIARRDNAKDILVYLAHGVVIRPDIISALLPFSSRLRIYAPELSDAQRADFVRAGARVHAEPMMLSEALATARLAVHFGGHGLACAALAAGVPQLVLSLHIEQDLTGQTLSRWGLGRLIRTSRPDDVISPDIIAELIEDSELTRRAERSGDVHRAMLGDYDALAVFESRSTRLLGL